MQTFVKLMLRLITNVTCSPTWRRRISSATSVTAWRSRPRAVASARPSLVDTSPPSSAPARTERTAGDAQSRAGRRLPASPVLMRLLHEAVVADQRGDAGAERLGHELGARGELRVDGQPLPEREALALRRATQLGNEGPRRLGVDVVDGERRNAAPVVETGREEPRIHARREVRRRL